MYYIGIDLGGTNIKAGVCDKDFKILGRASVRTDLPRPAEAIGADIASAAKIAVADAGLTLADIEWVGIGAPGSIDPVKGEVVYANNLGFLHAPLVKYVEQGLGGRINVYLENDANAAAFGEALAGAAKDVSHSVAITLGTGVGGGIVIDNKIYTGFNYAGAELGHMVIEKDGWPCTCGRKGCWESYSSATGLVKMTKEAMLADKNSGMWKLCDGDIGNAGGKTACDGVRAGDKTAKEVFDKYVDYLACGLGNIINIFQPEIINISGGISKEGEFLLAPLRERVDSEQYTRDIPRTKIVTAALGYDAGIIGAAFLGLNYK